MQWRESATADVSWGKKRTELRDTDSSPSSARTQQQGKEQPSGVLYVHSQICEKDRCPVTTARGLVAALHREQMRSETTG